MSTPSSLRIRRLPVLVALLLLLAMTPMLPATTAGAAVPPGTPVLRQTAELISHNVRADNYQGNDVALSADGSILAVATAEYYHSSPTAVIIYARSGDGWVTQTILRSPPITEGQNLWASSITISGDGSTLAVADELAFGGGGLVDLFTRSGRTWQPAGRLEAPRRWGGVFGFHVSLSGDGTRLAIGSALNIYIADTRSRVVRELPKPAGLESLGGSVAISPDGRTVVAGNPSIGPRPELGKAFVWVDEPVGGWNLRWRLEARPEHENSFFGASVAVNDAQTVVVGESFEHRAVSVFERRGTALVRTARFAPRYETQAHGLGSEVEVSADGSTVVAAAANRAAAGGSIKNAGAAYRWVRSPGGWVWGGLLSVAHPHTDEFQGSGTAMSADGRVVVLGALGRRSARLGETGAALVFSAVP